MATIGNPSAPPMVSSGAETLAMAGEDVETEPQASVDASRPAADLAVEHAINLDDSKESAGLALTPAVSRLPVELDVSIAVEDFRVKNLLALEPGHIIETRWGNGQDIPLSAGRIPLAWCEFEVLDADLAVRITHLA